MNKKQAIKECKELWSEIKTSGLSKEAFLYDTKQGNAWVARRYIEDCPLCELVGGGRCEDDCPLYAQYGDDCTDLGFHAIFPSRPKWFEAIEGLK